MSLSKTAYFLLLVWIVACAGTTSCTLMNSKATGDKAQTDGSKQPAGNKDSRVLSREEIIKTANRAARRHGFNLARYDVFYDEGNAGWKYYVTRLSPAIITEDGRSVWPEGAFEANLRSHWPKLDGHDYQALIYYGRWAPRDRPGIEGRTWIVVDRNTGEVLLVVDQPG